MFKKTTKKIRNLIICLLYNILFILKTLFVIIIIIVLFYLNAIMVKIAISGSDYEVVEVSKEENHCEVIITEYNDSFIVMDGTVNDDILTICNSKFKIVDKNDLGGYIRHVYYKDIKVE